MEQAAKLCTTCAHIKQVISTVIALLHAALHYQMQICDVKIY